MSIFRRKKRSSASQIGGEPGGSPKPSLSRLQEFRQSEPSQFVDDGVCVKKATKQEGTHKVSIGTDDEPARALLSTPGAYRALAEACQSQEYERLLFAADMTQDKEWFDALVELGTSRAAGVIIGAWTFLMGDDDPAIVLGVEALKGLGATAHDRLLGALDPAYTRAWVYDKQVQQFRRNILAVLSATGDRSTIERLNELGISVAMDATAQEDNTEVGHSGPTSPSSRPVRVDESRPIALPALPALSDDLTRTAGEYERVHHELERTVQAELPNASATSSKTILRGLGIDDPNTYDDAHDLFRPLISLSNLGPTDLRAWLVRLTLNQTHATALLVDIHQVVMPKVLLVFRDENSRYIGNYCDPSMVEGLLPKS